MSISNLAEVPTPQHLTLLFKYHKSTTVLSVLPSQDLTSIKSTLLAILRTRNIATLPGTSIPLPTKPTDLEFGILVDRRDASKGWVFAEDRASVAGSTALSKKKVAGGAKKEGPVSCFGDLEVRDGTWVAYRLRQYVKDEGLDDGDVGMDDDSGWNVVVPSYDDDEQEGEGVVNNGDEDEMDIPIPKPRNNVAG